jgi:hypothetical protein
MKKLLFALVMLWSTLTVLANDSKGKDGTGQYATLKKELKRTGACQMTMSAMVGAPGNQMEIKCTYTGYNCWVAIVQVLICLEDLKKEVIQ